MPRFPRRSDGAAGRERFEPSKIPRRIGANQPQANVPGKRVGAVGNLEISACNKFTIATGKHTTGHTSLKRHFANKKRQKTRWSGGGRRPDLFLNLYSQSKNWRFFSAKWRFDNRSNHVKYSFEPIKSVASSKQIPDHSESVAANQPATEGCANFFRAADRFVDDAGPAGGRRPL